MAYIRLLDLHVTDTLDINFLPSVLPLMEPLVSSLGQYLHLPETPTPYPWHIGLEQEGLHLWEVVLGLHVLGVPYGSSVYGDQRWS